MAEKTNNNIQPPAPEVAMTLDQLADRIVQVDETLRQQAAHAVNCMSSESGG